MKSLWLMLTTIVLGASLWAQGQGRITGRITSPSGAPVPNAVVLLTSASDGSSRRVLAAADGTFTVISLAPGAYKVEVESTGFKRATQNELVITATAPVEMTVKLEPGSITETVEIRAAAPVIQPESGEVSREYDARILQELPVQDRNVQEFIGLMPGVTPPLPATDGLRDPHRHRAWNTNGQNAAANYRTFDGVANQEAFIGTEIHVAPLQTVRHLDVRTSNYSADAGRAGGSVSDVNSQAGTNDVHGSLFEFYAPGTFQARNFFNPPPNPQPHYVSNQFGASIGGPIVRDSMFFFLSYEGSYLRQGMTAVSTVPTPDLRAGNFSALQGITLYDPRTGTETRFLQIPFTNNRIPSSAINPLSAALLQALPLPNQPGLVNNYVRNVPFRNDGHRPDGRLDWRIDDDTYAFARYGHSNYFTFAPSPLGVFGNGGENRLRNHTAVLGLTHNFSPSVASDVRLGYTRYSDAPHPIGFERGSLPAGVASAFPNGLPYIQITGMNPLGPAPDLPNRNISNNWNLVNISSAQTGRHSIQWGFDVWWIRGDGFQTTPFGPRGTFMFTPGPTLVPATNSLGPVGSYANAFASFLLGAPTQIGQYIPAGRGSYQNWQVAGFVSDRVRFGRLTLDLGLRYEFFTPLKLRNGASGFSVYNARTNQLMALSGGVDQYGNMEWNFNNWAPRFGFAFRATDRTVIRGGYAISYWNQPLQMDTNIFIPGTDGFQRGVGSSFGVAGTFGPLQAGTASAGLAPNLSFTAAPGRLKTPSAQSYSLLLQHELGWGAVLDIGYVGNLGRHLPYTREMNAAQPGSGVAGLPFNNAAFGFRTVSTLERDNALNSNFNSLQVNATKRFSQSFSASLAYTWSKSLDYGNGTNPLLNPFDRRANYGPSDWDRPHTLTISHNIQLPFGPGSKYLKSGTAAHIFGQWQLAGVFRYATGTPVTVTADPTLCNCPGVTPTADVVFAGTQTVFEPVYFSSFYYGYGFGFFPYEVPVFAFDEPGRGRIGSAGRNNVRGSNLTNYNVSVFRNFPIHERGKLEIRGEAYNISNTPHFATPVGNINSLRFGQSTSVLPGYGPRTLQFAARVVF